MLIIFPETHIFPKAVALVYGNSDETFYEGTSEAAEYISFERYEVERSVISGVAKIRW